MDPLTPESGTTVGTHDAEAQFAELLGRVEQGESIVITRHGSPIARLVPYAKAIDKQRVREAITAIRRTQQRQTLGVISIEELIDEGREN